MLIQHLDFITWSSFEHSAKPNTHRSYEAACNSLLIFFKDKFIDQIEPEDVERFKQWRSKQRRQSRKKNKVSSEKTLKLPVLKPATINRELACLKIIFNRFIKNDVLTKNPVSRIKFLKENNNQMRVVSYEEERLYLFSASQPLQDVATLIIETGMRPEEVFRITRRNVHLDKNYIFIPFGKTKSAERKIPLSSRAYEVLEKRLAEIDSEYLFITESTGKPITTLKTAHKGAINRSNIEWFRIYDLRHTFATRFVESGGDLVTLKALLGHTNIQMVTRYAHPTEKHQFDAIKKMEAVRMAKQA